MFSKICIIYLQFQIAKVIIYKGCESSMLILAQFFEKRKGIKVNKKEAARYYKMSADK